MKVFLVTDFAEKAKGAFVSREGALEFASTEPEEYCPESAAVHHTLPVRAEVRLDEELGLLVERHFVPQKGTEKGKDRWTWWFVREMLIQDGVSKDETDPVAKLAAAREAETRAENTLREARTAVLGAELEAAAKSLPEGSELVILESDYYGSHRELDERTGPVLLAVPEGVDVSDVRLSHGSGGRKSDGVIGWMWKAGTNLLSTSQFRS